MVRVVPWVTILLRDTDSATACISCPFRNRRQSQCAPSTIRKRVELQVIIAIFVSVRVASRVASPDLPDATAIAAIHSGGGQGSAGGKPRFVRAPDGCFG